MGKFSRKKEVVQKNIWDYNYVLNGQAGIGKTTSYLEMFTKLLGLDGNCLINVGKEPYPSHTAHFWILKAPTFEDLLDIVNEFYDNHDDYQDLKMVAFDSIDEVYRLAEEYVVEKYNEEQTRKGKYDETVNSISQAYGGFQRGEKKVISLVVDELFKLNDVGIHLFFIGHTKQKNKKDLMNDIEYEMVTSNLDNQYFTAIKDKVNIVGCAYYEREMSNIKDVKDAFTGKQKKIGRIAEEKRVISFRDEEHVIDVKSHLEFIEPKCDFEVDTMIRVLNEAIEKQVHKYDVWVQENVEQATIEPQEIIIEEAEESKLTREEMLQEIQDNGSNIDQNKLLKIVTKYGIDNLNDAPLEAIEKIHALI